MSTVKVPIDIFGENLLEKIKYTLHYPDTDPQTLKCCCKIVSSTYKQTSVLNELLSTLKLQEEDEGAELDFDSLRREFEYYTALANKRLDEHSKTLEEIINDLKGSYYYKFVLNKLSKIEDFTSLFLKTPEECFQEIQLKANSIEKISLAKEYREKTLQLARSEFKDKQELVDQIKALEGELISTPIGIEAPVYALPDEIPPGELLKEESEALKIKDLDVFNHYIGGGFRTDQSYLFMARAGEGKSVFLINCMRWILEAHPPDEHVGIFYITTEGHLKNDLRRCVQMFEDWTMEQYVESVNNWRAQEENEPQYVKTFRRLREQYKTRVIIYHRDKETKLTVSQVKSFIKMGERYYNVKAKYLILDYIDNITLDNEFGKQDYEIQARVFEDLQTFCSYEDICFITATQMGRDDYSIDQLSDITNKAGRISGAIVKYFKASFVFSLYATPRIHTVEKIYTVPDGLGSDMSVLENLWPNPSYLIDESAQTRLSNALQSTDGIPRGFFDPSNLRYIERVKAREQFYTEDRKIRNSIGLVILGDYRTYRIKKELATIHLTSGGGRQPFVRKLDLLEDPIELASDSLITIGD